MITNFAIPFDEVLHVKISLQAFIANLGSWDGSNCSNIGNNNKKKAVRLLRENSYLTLMATSYG